jgi:hypothetical protein
VRCRCGASLERPEVLQLYDHLEHFAVMERTRLLFVHVVAELTAEEVLVPRLGTVDGDITQADCPQIVPQQQIQMITDRLVTREQ